MFSDAGKFHQLFERWARRVRARITTRTMLSGIAVGLTLGAIASAGVWKTQHSSLRPWMATAGAIGLLGGGVIAIRRRWSDTDVALFLDGRLRSDEAITTALELRNRAEEDDLARAVVVRQAADVLEKGEPKKARVPVLRWHHSLIPLSAAALVMVARLPAPPPEVPPPPPGTTVVRIADIEGLEKAAALGALSTPDDAQRERLKKIAEDAKRLREKLGQGMERREAQSEIARLRDAVAAERALMSDAEHRAGLEAAHGRLAQNPLTRDAAKALGDRDITRFDEQMQKLANEREKKDRDAAKKSLEEAAQAAKENGAKDLARMLEEQKRLFEERSKRGEALRELAKALGDGLPPDAKKDLEEFNNNGLDKNSAKLAERLADALEKLSPEERQRLAEKLKDNLENGEMDPMSKEQMKDLAEDLNSPEGQKKLEEMLRKMANEPPESGDAERDRALGEAEKGLGQAEGELGGVPVPMPGNQPGQGQGQGQGQNGQNGQGQGKGQNGQGQNGQGGPGSKKDFGTGDHKGQSAEVSAEELRARAGGKINKAAPMPGVVTGRGVARPGEAANVRGTDAIGEVAPDEINGVERSDIPEEYREQVGRYFSP